MSDPIALPAPATASHPDLTLVRDAAALLVQLAGQTRPDPDRLRTLEAALRDLREGTTCLNVLIREAKARGTPEKVAGWQESIGAALESVSAVLPQLALELKARRSRLGALLAVTRQRAEVDQGYRPMRGGRMGMVQRQVRHCVQLVV